MSTNPLNLARLPDDDEAAHRILAWVRRGHRGFTRMQVVGLRIPGTREALDRLELHGYVCYDTNLKRFYARPRALEDDA